jgi:hypothetical protein
MAKNKGEDFGGGKANLHSDGPGMKGWQQGRSGEVGQVTSSDQTSKSSTSIDGKFYKRPKGEFHVDVNDGKGMSKG